MNRLTTHSTATDWWQGASPCQLLKWYRHRSGKLPLSHRVTISLLSLILVLIVQSHTYPMDSESQELIQKFDFGRQDDLEKKGWPTGFQRTVNQNFPKYLPIKIVAKHPENQGTAESIRRLLARVAIAYSQKKMPWEVIPERVPKEIDQFLEALDLLDPCLEIRMDGGAVELKAPVFRIETAFSYAFEFEIESLNLDGFAAGAELVLYRSDPNTGGSNDKNIVKVFPSREVTGSQGWQKIQVDPIQMEKYDASFAQLRFYVRPLERSGFQGTVRIDSIRVLKLPQISLSMNRSVYLFHSDEPIEAKCVASGLESNIPNVEMKLVDHLGKVVRSEILSLDERISERPQLVSLKSNAPSIKSGNENPSWKGQSVWNLPKLEPGYYTLRCRLNTNKKFLFEEKIHFAVFDADKVGDDRFGCSLPIDRYNMPIVSIPGFLQRIGMRNVKIPVWIDSDDAKRVEEYGWLIERLKAINISVVGVLDLPPQKLRRLFAGNDLSISDILEREEVWQPLLEPILNQVCMEIDTLQVGWDQDPSFSGNDQLDERLKTLRSQLNLTRPRSSLIVPWSALHGLASSKTANQFQFSIQPSWTPDELLKFLERRTQLDPKKKNDAVEDCWVNLDSLEADSYSDDERLTHLVESMISILRGRTAKGWIANPFDNNQGWMQNPSEPGFLLSPFRTLSMALNEHSYLGRLALPNRSTNHLLSKNGSGLLIIWNKHAKEEETYLGEKVTARDLFGRKVAIENEKKEFGTVQRFPVSPYPILIEGVDISVAQWRMGLGIENPIVETTRSRTQTLNIRFANPTSQPILGKMKVDAAEILQSPSSATFKLGPQSTSIIPIDVELRPNATSQKTKLRFDIQVQGIKEYEFSEFRELQVGLSDIDLQVDQTIDDEGNLLLAIEILNRTGKIASFDCSLYLPNRPYERMFLKNVGERMVRTMAIRGGKEFENSTLWLKCEEIESKRIVNQQILVRAKE